MRPLRRKSVHLIFTNPDTRNLPFEKLLIKKQKKGKVKARTGEKMDHQKHLSGEDRLQIENRLKHGKSLSRIAKA